MSNVDITRAWKDEAYRQSLSQDELAALPANPVGEIELTDSDLEAVYGGQTALVGCSIICQSVACNVQSVACHSVVCRSAVCHSAVCTILGTGCP